ncbi:MAG: PQQ-dependent sugar dehydrogenase [Gemmatimonadaceae bacterium]
MKAWNEVVRSGPPARLARLVALAWLALAGTACRPDTGSATATSNGLRLVEVASGLANPVHLTAPAGDPRLFIVEQEGRIRIVRDGSLLPTPFLDIESRVRSGGERGLLSVAFHPDYASNGFLYVNYTDRDGDTRVERYSVTGNADIADPASAKLLLTVDQPYGNHNGGLIVFGPDDMLYIGMGDGGSGGDPHGHGQNLGTLLGTMLRIDVDGGEPYAIPSDNPFRDRPGARAEIWAYGLRNPWRFAFDRGGERMLYIADVGQNRLEEINAVDAAAAGLNYGWNIMEGTSCYNAGSCEKAGLTLPVHEYDHSDGCSVTGGHVYRGSAAPSVVGHYFYSDYCEGWLRSFRLENGAVTEEREWNVGDVGNVLSFGEDSGGELHLLSSSGRVYRFAAGE